MALSSHPGLHVGECVPFYFCPRSVMLYVIARANSPEMSYRGGQEPIIHLEADLSQTVARAVSNERRWAFTTSNAASSYFDDFSDLDNLDKLDWDAIQANQWSGRQERKQAEFLVEFSFPWSLISRIGVYSHEVGNTVLEVMRASDHRPPVEINRGWYY